MAEWTGPYLRPEMRLLAELRLAEPGKSIRQIAMELGLNYQTCLMWTKKAVYIAYESFLVNKVVAEITPEAAPERKALRQRYLDHAQEMQDRLLTILETSPDAKIQKEIAFDWLDRAELGAPKKDQEKAPVFIIPERMLDALVTRAAEAGLLPSEPVHRASLPDPDTSVDGEIVENGDTVRQRIA